MSENFNRLLEIMSRLRKDCPWDREQSLDSLQKFLVEETYECIDASQRRKEDGDQALIEELGDVLLQVVFQAEILSETHGRPIIDEIIKGLSEKLIRRHPHVFESKERLTADEVIHSWNKIKDQEKGSGPQSLSSRFSKVPKSAPSLRLAFEIGKTAGKHDFDWENSEEIFLKVLEEVKELEMAVEPAEKEEELGDLLFTLSQWARKEALEPELAAMKACQKFLNRFDEMERILEEENQTWEDCSRQKKEELWRAAKKAERQRT